MAACAWYHHKLGSKFSSVESLVSEVQEWAHKEYAEALERGDSMTPKQKEHIADKLSEYLGLSKKYCFESNVRIPEFAFFRELLREEGLTIGRYDGRLTGKEEKKIGDFGDGDPSDDATGAPFTTSILGYMAKDLGIKTELTYEVSGPLTSWSSPQGSYPETSSDLRHVLTRNPHFKVLYCCGYYDLACPLNGTVYTVNHMGLDQETRSRVSFAFYPAGHMMYIEKSSRKKLHDDVSAFEKSCLVK
jgi:carboxypeptidase C (cathepsin A)